MSSLPSWCEIVLLAIMVSNCPKCQMVLGVKLSAVSNGPRIGEGGEGGRKLLRTGQTGGRESRALQEVLVDLKVFCANNSRDYFAWVLMGFELHNRNQWMNAAPSSKILSIRSAAGPTFLIQHSTTVLK